MRTADAAGRNAIKLISVVTITAGTLAGCGSGTEIGQQSDQCEQAEATATEMSDGTELIAREAVTAGEVRQWLRDRRQPDDPEAEPRIIRELEDDEIVSVCAFRGTEFRTPRPPEAPAPDTAVLFVLPNQHVQLFSAGPRETFGSLIPSQEGA